MLTTDGERQIWTERNFTIPVGIRTHAHGHTHLSTISIEPPPTKSEGYLWRSAFAWKVCVDGLLIVHTVCTRDFILQFNPPASTDLIHTRFGTNHTCIWRPHETYIFFTTFTREHSWPYDISRYACCISTHCLLATAILWQLKHDNMKTYWNVNHRRRKTDTDRKKFYHPRGDLNSRTRAYTPLYYTNRATTHLKVKATCGDLHLHGKFALTASLSYTSCAQGTLYDDHMRHTSFTFKWVVARLV